MRRTALLFPLALRLGVFQPGILFAGDAGPVRQPLEINNGQGAASASRARINRPNILMVVLDTSRADHFSAYGYKRPTTPNTDNLARRGILFKSAYSQTNWTLPSFASFLTGKYPRSIGMFESNKRLTGFDYIDPKLGEAETTLPEALKKAGYRTAGFFTGRFNGPAYGFNQGFDLHRSYRSNSDMKRDPEKPPPTFLPEAFKWMEEDKDAPFFIILHSMRVHRPFLPPDQFVKPYAGDYKGIMASTWLSKAVLSSIKKDDKGWSFSPDNSAAGGGPPSPEAAPLPPENLVVRLSQADIDYIAARYDASINYADEFIGELTGWAQKSPQDNTVIIVLSDHGEGLGDHGGFLHCTDPPRLYQELIHVPLIIYIPKKWLNTGVAVVSQPVELVDLMPTILDLVKVPGPRPEGIQGKSLIGVITGEKKEEAGRAAFAETLGYGLHVQSLKTGDWKLIRTGSRDAAPGIELYDLVSDPSEKHNLAPQKPDVAGKLLNQLNAWSGNNEK